jgi:hypothetical protein
MRAEDQAGGDARRNESEHERLDRNLEELNGELRVVVTGVQVLFAFLLIVPFNTGFAHVGSFEKAVYAVTLLLAAMAALCTIAPSARHRFTFRHDDKRGLVFSANRTVIAGLAFLALAMIGCLLLVGAKLFGPGWGAVIAGGAAIPFLSLWFAIPIRRAASLEARDAGGARHGAQRGDDAPARGRAGGGA